MGQIMTDDRHESLQSLEARYHRVNHMAESFNDIKSRCMRDFIQRRDDKDSKQRLNKLKKRFVSQMGESDKFTLTSRMNSKIDEPVILSKATDTRSPKKKTSSINDDQSPADRIQATGQSMKSSTRNLHHYEGNKKKSPNPKLTRDQYETVVRTINFIDERNK